MKYIRTKDKIYENILGDVLPNLERIECQDILKQADTIEELCDEFIGVWKHCCDGEEKHCDECYYIKEKNIFYYAELEYKHKDILYLFDMFYGAIWTDKGLIYVARMNKEGKWELL